MPAALRHGLMEDLDFVGVKRAAEFIAEGHRASINVSTGSIRRKGLVEEIVEEFRKTGASPSDLTIEISETALMHDQASGLRFVDELATRGPYGQHQRPGRQSKRRIGQAPTDQRRGGSDLHFLDSVIESLVVHDDVKELGHVRLQRKRRHPPPADQLRVDGPVCAGPQRRKTPRRGA